MVNAINAPGLINLSLPNPHVGITSTAAAHTPLCFAGFRITPGWAAEFGYSHAFQVCDLSKR